MRVKIFNNTAGKNFTDYCHYVMSKADLSELLCSRGVITYSADMMASSFNFRCNTSPRIGRSAIHMVIQFREQENLNTNLKEKSEIIRDFLYKMDWSECQYIAVMHHDVPGNAHCHLVINLIQDNGLLANDSYSIMKARRIIRNMTDKEMRIDPEKEDRIRNVVKQAIEESSSMRSLRYNLSMEIIEMKIDSEGKMIFNEKGNPTSFSFPGITALEIARKMHLSRIKKSEEQRIKKKNELKMSQIRSGMKVSRRM